MNAILLAWWFVVPPAPELVFRLVPCQQAERVQMANREWTCDVVNGFYRDEDGRAVVAEKSWIEGWLGKAIR
jgi:hypothetical protein